MPDPSPRLDDYVLLSRSGLRVSRLCLGTMTLETLAGCEAFEASYGGGEGIGGGGCTIVAFSKSIWFIIIASFAC